MVRLRVRELAQAQGLDIAKLARRADLGYTTVYFVWHGMTENPGLRTLRAIARVLGVKIADLIIEDDDDVGEGQQVGDTKKSDLATAS